MTPVLIALLAGCALLFVQLWWRKGRTWRKLESAALPQVCLYPRKGAQTTFKENTAFVFFDGSFNTAGVHFSPLRESILLEHGAVYEVQYNYTMFDANTAVNAVLQEVRRSGHSRVIFVGVSMGIVPAMMAIARFHKIEPTVDIGLLSLDPAASLQSLPKLFQRLIRATTWLRPGPIWNALLGKVVRTAMFKPLPEEQRGPGYDPALLTEHYAAMNRCEVSAILGMNGAIKRSYYPKQGELPADLRVVCLFSTDDGVIDTEASKREMQQRLPQSVMIDVEGGHHADFVENPRIWQPAFEAGVTKLIKEMNENMGAMN